MRGEFEVWIRKDDRPEPPQLCPSLEHFGGGSSLAWTPHLRQDSAPYHSPSEIQLQMWTGGFTPHGGLDSVRGHRAEAGTSHVADLCAYYDSFLSYGSKISCSNKISIS